MTFSNPRSRSDETPVAGIRLLTSLVSPAPSLELVVGDLSEEGADVLISPAGDDDATTGRVERALRRAAGEGLDRSFRAAAGRLQGGQIRPGTQIVTEGFDLRCRYVLHLVLDAAPSDRRAARATLERHLRAAFDRCALIEAQTVALPAVGTGAYGYRVSDVAVASVRAALAAQERAKGPRCIRFVLSGPATLEAFLHTLSAERAARSLS